MNTGRIIVLLLAVLVFGTDAAAWVQTRTSFGTQGIYWPRRAVPVVLQVGGRGAFCPDRGLWGNFWTMCRRRDSACREHLGAHRRPGCNRPAERV